MCAGVFALLAVVSGLPAALSPLKTARSCVSGLEMADRQSACVETLLQ